MTRDERRLQLANLRAELDECEIAQRQAHARGDLKRYQELSARIYQLEAQIHALQREAVTE